MLSIIAQGTAVAIPSYVPWIILLPALAGLIQNFFGKRLPRQGDWLVIGAMFGALALAVMTTVAWLGLPDGDYFRSTTTWFELAQGVKFDVGLMVDGSRFVHASTSSKRVRMASLDKPYWRQRLIGAGSYFR